jgi:hypothetical protein
MTKIETNIIFLDIDGTLNKFCVGSLDFDPSCVAAFNRIIDATGAAIVLSSSRWPSRSVICEMGSAGGDEGERARGRQEPYRRETGGAGG